MEVWQEILRRWDAAEVWPKVAQSQIYNTGYAKRCIHDEMQEVGGWKQTYFHLPVPTHKLEWLLNGLA